MSNANSIKINLNAGSRTNITDEWYFKTSDEGKGSNKGYVIYPAKTIVVEAQQPDTAGLNAALHTSGGVQMDGKNNTQPAVAVENTGEKNRETSNEVYKSSSETPDEAETPVAIVNEGSNPYSCRQ